MEKIFLRVYNREIENMIEGGKLDEAVAHCQHILQAFPMHVETYRLLGKAFLEDRRYTDAADIFQRVLLAVPDDFMSHLGMSIIRDDQGRLNDAIWHMERALEIQPSNSAVQNELRHLYGRRDGVEPSKIRLGRDALANMYSQGELFPQAIAEFLSLLAEDPNRPDLQVMLTRAYYLSGQKAEAKETAATLLKKYPYCMDALRVFLDILHDSTPSENLPVFRHRLFMLDPYSSSLETFFASDQVDDSAVSLDRLDYKPGLVSGSSQPDWSSSLGIKLDTDRFGPRIAPAIDAGTAPFPDWMHPVERIDDSHERKEGTPDIVDLPPVAPMAKADLPEWLLSEGSMRADRENHESEPPSDNSPEDMPGAKDDIPDWLKAIYPPEVSQEMNRESQTTDESALSGDKGSFNQISPSTQSGNIPEQTQESTEPPSPGGPDIPDWLKPATPASDRDMEIVKPGEPAESQFFSSENVPGFLKPSTEAEPVEKDTIGPQKSEESLPVEVDQTPGFLHPKTSSEAAGEKLPASPGNEKTQPEEIEERPEYSEDRVLEEAADSSNLVPEPVLPEESISEAGSRPGIGTISSPEGEAFPDWMKEVGAGVAASVPLVAEQPVTEQPVSEQPIAEQPVSDQPVTEQPVTELPVAEQPVVEQLEIEQPVTEQPFPEQPVIEQPVSEQPVIEQLVPEQPVAEQLFTGQPISEQPVLEQQAFEQTPPEQPIHEEMGLGSIDQEGLTQSASESGTMPQGQSVDIPEKLEEPEEKPVEALATSSDQSVGETTSEVGERSVSEAPFEVAARTEAGPAGSEADTLAWLERPSSDQEPAKETASVTPDESREAPSEVNQELADTQPMVPAMEESVASQSAASKNVEESQGEQLEPAGEEKPGAAEEELPEWLKSLGSLSEPVAAPLSDLELPDWLGNPPVDAGAAPEISEPKPSVELADTSRAVSEPTLPEETFNKTGIEPAEAIPSPEEEAFPDWMRMIGAGATAAVQSDIGANEELPTVERVVSEQPVSESPASGQLITGQPVIEPAFPEQPALEQVITEPEVPGQPVTEPSASEKPIAEQPVAEIAFPEQPISEEPVMEAEVPEQPGIEQPVPEQSIVEQPVEETVFPEQPISEEAVMEPAVPEQPGIEQPVPEQSIVEQPVEETPLPEQPVSEQTMMEPAVPEQPEIEQQAPEQSIVEQPVEETPFPEQPLSEEAVMEPAVPEQPGIEQPAPEQSIVEQPAVEPEFPEQPISEEAVMEPAVPEQPEIEQLAAGQSIVEQPVEETPLPEQPVSEQAVMEPAVPEQPEIEQPALEQSVVEQPAAATAVPEQPISEEAVLEPAVPEQPEIEQPAAEQSVVEQPAAEPAFPEQPISEQQAIEQIIPEQSLADKVDLGPSGQEVLTHSAADSGTISQDRSEEVPEWLKEPGEKQVETLAESSAKPIDKTTSEFGEKPGSEASSEAAAKMNVEPAVGEAETLAWLERLSAVQEQSKEEALVSPQESQKAPSEVSQENADTQPAAGTKEESATALSAAVENVEEVQSEIPVEPTGEEKTAMAEEEIPEWLKGFGDLSEAGEGAKAGEESPEAQHIITPTFEPGSASIPEEPIWEDENIPVAGQAVPTTPEEWVPAEAREIAGMESGETPESKPVDETLLAGIPGPISETIQVAEPESPIESLPVAEPESTSEIMPTEKTASPVESAPVVEPEPISKVMPLKETENAPEPAPVPGMLPTPDIPLSSGPVPASESAQVSESETAAESIPVPEPGSEIQATPVSEPISPSVQDLVERQPIEQPGMLPSVLPREKDSEILASAQALLAENSFDESMKQYMRLVKRGRLLADVTKDLREASHRHPAEVNIWQTLGDAYMRANHLEDALEAYTKGEELLR